MLSPIHGLRWIRYTCCTRGSLANLKVANTGSTALTVTFTGVPSGTYYVRVRAVNALGGSVASNERVVVVP